MNDSEGGSYGAGRTQYREQIHVKGDFGTRTVRRDEEPDYGDTPVHAVVTFDGVVDFRDDAVVGVVTLGERAVNRFINEVGDRVDNYDIQTFEVSD